MVRIVYDIETLRELFLYCDIDIDTGEKAVFEISFFKNELYAFVAYLKKRKITYHIGFNNVSFDSQVIQYILDNYDRWYNLSTQEILEKIYQFAQDVIDDTNAGLFPPYKERSLDIDQIDLFRIHHYDNEARRCSLKWLEFSMDMENIEEMPIWHGTIGLTIEQIRETTIYCWNDVDATLMFYKITVGETELEEYKGKNKIQDRLDLIAELGMPKETMNYSDVKIGDELNKMGYCKESGMKPNQLWDLKKERFDNKKVKKGFTFGDCIPSYVSFKTPAFQSFFEKIKPVRVKLGTVKKGEQEFPLTYNGTTYTIARGGIHSGEKKRILIPRDNEILRDADVGSQYPNAIRKRQLYPFHLGPKWLVNFVNKIVVRLEYKKKSNNKEDSKWRVYKGLAEMFKLALNGGGFGKTNERTNWQYDPFVTFACTIGNQFEILMLVESLEIAGIHCVSANTDGIVCLFDRSLEPKYNEICKEWEKIVGNEELGQLEYTDYKKMVQTSVNDYIAVDITGKVKKKGDFLTSIELHKNKSRRIIPLALEQYFLNNVPVEKTISEHQNIFDFCIGVKASRDYHYEVVDRKTYEKTVYHRLVRHFVSTDGKKLLKIKNEDSESTGNPITQCEAGEWLSTIFNVATKKEMKDYNVNYNYYIEKANDIIQGIEKPRKKKIYEHKDQLKLF